MDIRNENRCFLISNSLLQAKRIVILLEVDLKLSFENDLALIWQYPLWAKIL
jgi:hypothetical protein